jgi:hypothetical protein
MIVSVLNENVAQVNPDSKDILFYQIMNARGTGESDAYIGSQYLVDEWYPVELTLKNGTRANLSKAKLNLMTSNIEALFLGDEKELLAQHFDIAEINVNGEYRRFYSKTAKNIKGMNDSGFYEVLGKGPDQVIVRHSTYIQKPHPQAKIIGTETRHKIVKKTNLFVLHQDILHTVKSKNDLKKIYKNDAKEIDNILERTDIDLKNPVGLLKVIDILNNQN